ncbi:hypothetical protein PIROE2DRAFT_5766 [Piromyces sp. E2]|nr:hypothetical protein PIROE2DRAFT_5766 [Piromyces sp. E2]|eukprot:OUM66906.1 hypothetical protein PIROE2DRAFT_5766 [Piromyces sp. E2]
MFNMIHKQPEKVVHFQSPYDSVASLAMSPISCAILISLMFNNREIVKDCA